MIDPNSGQMPAEPVCQCHETAIRVKTFSDGRQHYVKQCLQCGRNLGAVPKLSVRAPSLLEPFDEVLPARWDALYRQYLDQRRAVRIDQLQQRSSEWWAIYDAYLLTPEWRDKRDKVIARDKGVCQGCFSRRAVSAHHLSYEHVTCEFLFELVAVCAACHDRLHPLRAK